MPLVSILVVVFKARERLPSVLESIYRQAADDVELIVIDGGSNDGTLEYLRSQGNKIDYWLSEPDRGIYDAMNKAVAGATGTFLLHLNVGDLLVHIPRERLERVRETDVALYSFPVSLDIGPPFQPSYGRGLRFFNTLHHQGTFYRRTSFPTYDTALKVFADFDVNQRLSLSGAKGLIGNEVVAFHECDGVSSKQNPALIAEFLSVVRRNHGDNAVLMVRILGKWRGLKARVKLLRAANRKPR